MAKPTSYRPNKRELQKLNPSKGPGVPKSGSIPDGKQATAFDLGTGPTGVQGKPFFGMLKNRGNS